MESTLKLRSAAGVDGVIKSSVADRAEAVATGEEPLDLDGKFETKTAINEFDLVQPRAEALFKPPAFLLEPLRALLCDPRDEIMLHFYLNMLMVAVPMFGTFFAIPLIAPQSSLAALYVSHPKTIGFTYFLLVYCFFLKRFNYMLHYSSHRQMFKSTPVGTVLNTIITHLYAPICGVPSGMYYMHHIVMHHGENNIFPWDLSATMHYQRDSFVQFLGYWARFFLAIHIQLPFVALRRHHLKLAMTTLGNTAFFFSCIYLASRVNPVFAFWALMFPYFLTCFLLMFGNWGQHIFVDPKRHASNYGLTYSCINNSHNQCSFNDGYHVIHHINASMHWSQLPSTFSANIQKFIKEDSLVFEGIDFFMLAVLVFAKQWKWVAKYYKHITGGERPSEEAIIARLKSLCVPVPASLPAPLDTTPIALSKFM